MFREDPDRRDDLVNPLKPWRSAGLIFVLAWAAVLADALNLPIIGRPGLGGGFRPITLLLPFVIVAAYFAFWTVWRIGARRHRRSARALRERLGDQASPSGD